MGTEHQPGVLSRGLGLAALLVLATVVALSAASMFADQIRSLGESPANTPGPAAIAYEPR